MQVPVSVAQSSALRCILWLTPMNITPEAMAMMPTTTANDMALAENGDGAGSGEHRREAARDRIGDAHVGLLEGLDQGEQVQSVHRPRMRSTNSKRARATAPKTRRAPISRR